MSIILTTVQEFQEVAADPAAVANSGFLYTKDDLTITQLFYRASDGTITQLTPPGGAGTTPWQRTGTTVALDQTGDLLVLPFDDGSTDLGDSTHQWGSVWGRKFVMPGPLAIALPIAAHGYIYSAFYPPTGNIELYYKDDSAAAGIRLTPLAGPSGTSPWQRAGGIVDLSDAADTEVRPTTDNATALGTQLSRWSSIAAGPSGFGTWTAVAGNPTSLLSSTALSFGVGGATPTDVDLGRTAANTLSSATDNLIFIGSSAFRVKAFTGGSFNSHSAGQVFPKSSLGTGGLSMGTGLAAADVALLRTAANTFDVSNGALLSGNVQPLVTATGTLGTSGTAASKTWASVAVASGYGVFALAADANPTARLNATSVAFGPGGALPVDVALVRSITAVNALDLSNGAAGTGSIQPLVDTQGLLGIPGVGGKIFASMSATSHAAYAAGTDTQPKVEIRTAAAGGEARMGAGGAAAPDVYLSRTGAGTLTADDGAGNGITIVPSVDGTGNVGTAGLRFSLVRAVTITSGDVCFDDQACRICGQPFAEGDDIMLRVIGIEPDGDTGRRLTRTVPAHHGCR